MQAAQTPGMLLLLDQDSKLVLHCEHHRIATVRSPRGEIVAVSDSSGGRCSLKLSDGTNVRVLLSLNAENELISLFFSSLAAAPLTTSEHTVVCAHREALYIEIFRSFLLAKAAGVDEWDAFEGSLLSTVGFSIEQSRQSEQSDWEYLLGQSGSSSPAGLQSGASQSESTMQAHLPCVISILHVMLELSRVSCLLSTLDAAKMTRILWLLSQAAGWDVYVKHYMLLLPELASQTIIECAVCIHRWIFFCLNLRRKLSAARNVNVSIPTGR
jgi:hypothetical protein